MKEKFHLSIEGLAAEEEIEPTVLEAFRIVAREAREQGRRVSRSALVAMTNYSRYVGVSSLPKDDLLRVLVQVGEEALERSEEVLKGSDFAEALADYDCGDNAFGCYGAAAKILDRKISLDVEGLEEDLDEGEIG